MPPRYPSTSYDTRPPPPSTSSGFAAVNRPASNGFTAVNAKSKAATPSIIHAVPTPGHVPEQRATAADQTPLRDQPSEDKSVTGGNGSSKRFLSIRHPHQISETFAKRHHHCERIDSLNRGIWTWYGHTGTRDHPTTVPTEMYLRCHHDDCGRIDWRSIHGLKRHIVTNHEQPKGTIGSLEKALEKYGVPVKYIEAIEKRDGLGTGGTMAGADPKNTNIKSRMKETGDRRDFGRRNHPSTVQGMHRSYESGSPSAATPTPKADDHGEMMPHRDEQKLESTRDAPPNADGKSVAPTIGGFAAVNSAWQGINATPVTLPSGMPDHQSRYGHGQPPADIPHAAHRPRAGYVYAPFEPSWQAPNKRPRSGQQTSTEPVVSPHQQRISHETTASSGEARSVQPDVSEGKEEPRPVETAIDVDSNVDQDVDDAAENKSGHDPILDNERSDAQMTEDAHDAQEVTPTGVNHSKGAEQTDVEALVVVEQEVQHSAQEDPVQHAPKTSEADGDRINGSTQKLDDTVQIAESPTTTNDPSSLTRTVEEESGPTLKSAEPTHKRAVHSRRGSPRSSMATTTFSKVGTERAKEVDTETSSTVNTASKVGSGDDDSDSITVAPKLTMDRQKEKGRGKKTPKRQANGRFSRKRGR